MAKPNIHAINSAKRFGGEPEDYLAIHDKMDDTKAAHASMKHRIIFHSAYGIYLIEELFGHTITNSEGKMVCVRDVAEQHVIEDLGYIPSLDDWLKEMKEQPWMSGMRRVKVQVVD